MSVPRCCRAPEVRRGVVAQQRRGREGWLNSGTLLGAAIGSSLGGIVSDAGGASQAFLLATAAACLAVIAPVGFRASSFTSQPVPDVPPPVTAKGRHVL